MNSRPRALFVIFVALALVLSFGEGFPVGIERTDFLEGENPSKLSESIDKRFKRSDAGAVAADGQHDKDVDYDLLGKLMDEYLMKHGGNLDRELVDNEYDIIVENYEKHIREDAEKKKEKEKDKAISSGALTAPHKSEQHSTIRTSPEKIEGQTQRPASAIPPTAKDKWSVTPGKIGIPGDGSGSLAWTGDSKGGHRVHVVVYFD